ncbi:MAG: hypothetical protein JW969_08190 [Spirochaetales bacterium]|nr:hypothetical protein [Spirochaetales bacterium]
MEVNRKLPEALDAISSDELMAINQHMSFTEIIDDRNLKNERRKYYE